MSTRKKISETTANLRVAIRVRPMNSAEKEDKCTNIVKVNSLKSTISCKGKSFGPFFKVYDTDTSQSTIYEELVSSQIKNVIAGFNCTVFAYGQTGTGKTYTMEGGRTDAKSAKDDPSTGIIPRAVEDIFEKLESSGCEEYSLRVSYIELYNEELFDLLASNTDGDDRERLRIFDDPNKKGVIVSGVEEVPVRNRADVFKLLEFGAEKRRTAATLMNMHSSRSHSLFIVNVVIRENTVGGEELVKQGKLNLVDLAGSENIGRSGAQGSRAKEAGSINQSLLTLGRVIRSLTTNAQHIPYRESKLTRLLQDSLGGSTYTSLVATMSPASSNFEESQSTLEYATRAANIRNKPVCNTKVSKKTILKEYSDEIEKLRRDLRAAREKNGLFISEESHAEFQKNTERVGELEEQLDSVVDRLRRFTEDLMHMDEQYKNLYERKGELEERLRVRLREMAEREKELAETKDELQKYMTALNNMHVAASQTFSQLKKMRNAADDIRYDLKGYWKKVDEFTEADKKNSKSVASFLEEISKKIEKFEEDGKNIVEKGAGISKGFENCSGEAYENMSQFTMKVNEKSDGICNSAKEYCSNIEEMNENCEKMLKKFNNEMPNELAMNIKQFTEICEKFREDVKFVNERLGEKLGNVRDEINQFHDDIKPLIGELRGIACEDIANRDADRGELIENVDTTCAGLMEALKSMMKDVEKMSIKNAEICERQKIQDQCSQEKVMSTLSTIDDVHMSLNDFVSEETSDVDEILGNIAEKSKENRLIVEENCRRANEGVSQKICDVEKSSAIFFESSKSKMVGFERVLDDWQRELRATAENCEKNGERIGENGVKLAREMITELEDFGKNAEMLAKSAKDQIDAVNLEHVDPNENVSPRVTPYVLNVGELYNVPDPIDLVEDTDKFEEEENFDNFRVAKKRRVTVFMRRDSLLDSTNMFPSPSSLQKQREELNEEEKEN